MRKDNVQKEIKLHAHNITQHNKISSCTIPQAVTHPIASHSTTFHINLVIIKMATLQKPISRQKLVSYRKVLIYSLPVEIVPKIKSVCNPDCEIGLIRGFRHRLGSNVFKSGLQKQNRTLKRSPQPLASPEVFSLPSLEVSDMLEHCAVVP